MSAASMVRRITPLLLASLIGCQPQEDVSVVISPETVEVGTFRKHQFTAVVSGSEERGVTWIVQEGEAGGRITAEGVYTAPGTTGTFHIIATTRATPSKRASATVKVVEAAPEVTVAIEPAYQQVRARGQVTFEAQVLGLTHPDVDTTVTWTVQEDGGGSINAEGVYTAPDAAGEYHVVATSNANPLRSATARVEVREIAVQIVDLGEENDPLYPGGTRSFRATVTGSSNPAVTWSLVGEQGGTLAPQGEDEVLYTAPDAAGEYALVATSVEDPQSFGTFQIQVQAPPSVDVQIADGARAVNTLETLQLQAQVSHSDDTRVTWTVKAGGAGGTIDEDGLYTAPAVHGTDTVVATSVADPSKSDEVELTIRELLLTVTPTSASLVTGETVEFTASVQNALDTAVTFTLDPDTDAADGALTAGSGANAIVYTAPATAGSDTLRVTSAHNPNVFVLATITVTQPAPVTVSVTPTAQTILTGATVNLTAVVGNDPSNAGVTWAITETNGGTLAPSGLTAQYTAPSSPGVFHVVATSVAAPQVSATATLTVNEPANYGISISPVGPVSKKVGQTEQLSATVSHTPNTGVSWSVAPGGAGGTVDATGLYTAPAVVGVDTVVATSNDDPNQTAQVTVNVTSDAVVDATPPTAELVVHDTVTLTATVTGAVTQTVTWSVPAGAGSLSTTSGGTTVYTAPATPGTYTVTVTSDEDPSQSDTVVLTVLGPVPTGLFAHYAADQLGSTPDTGGEVGSWGDLSGNGYAVEQTEFMTARPLLMANAVNGRPSLRFDGTNDRLSNNTMPSAGTTTTIFIVHNADPTPGNLTLIDSPRVTSGVNHTNKHRIQIVPSGSTTLQAQMITSNFGSTSSVHTQRGVFQSVTALFDGANSRLRLNGDEATLANKPNAVPMNGVILGLKQDMSANAGPVELAEVLLYNRALTQAEIDEVEAYLRLKYALPPPAAN